MKNILVLAVALFSAMIQAQQLETGGPDNGLGQYGTPIQNFPVTAVAYEHSLQVVGGTNVTTCDLEYFQWQGGRFVWVNTEYGTTNCAVRGNRYYRYIAQNIRHTRTDKKAIRSKRIVSSGSLSQTAHTCFEEQRAVLAEVLGKESIREKLGQLGLTSVVLLVSDYSTLESAPQSAVYGAKPVEDSLKVSVIARQSVGGIGPCLALNAWQLEDVIRSW